MSPCVSHGKFLEEFLVDVGRAGTGEDWWNLSRRGLITALKSHSHMTGTEGCWVINVTPSFRAVN